MKHNSIPMAIMAATLFGAALAVSVADEPPALIAPGEDAREVEWSKWLATRLEGEAEHVLFSGRRVDVLTNDLAIEVEWCRREKVAEAIEQATYYGVATGRPGAVVLLVGREDHKAERVAYDLVVDAAARGRVRAVAVLDVRNPDVFTCCEHLGLVPTPYRPEPRK